MKDWEIDDSFVVEAVPDESEKVTSESDAEAEEAQSTVEVDSEVEEVIMSQTEKKKRRRKKGGPLFITVAFKL
jgi:hypothetical protein